MKGILETIIVAFLRACILGFCTVAVLLVINIVTYNLWDWEFLMSINLPLALTFLVSCCSWGMGMLLSIAHFLLWPPTDTDEDDDHDNNDGFDPQLPSQPTERIRRVFSY